MTAESPSSDSQQLPLIEMAFPEAPKIPTPEEMHETYMGIGAVATAANAVRPSYVDRESPARTDLGVVTSDKGRKAKPAHIRKPKKIKVPEDPNPKADQINIWANPADPVATRAAYEKGRREANAERDRSS